MKKAKIYCRKRMRRSSYSEQFILKHYYFLSPFVWTILKHFLSLKFRHKSRKKNPPSSCGTSLLEYLFEAVRIIFHVKKCVFQWWSSLTIVYWVLPWIWDDEWIGKRAIAGCKLTTSARIMFFFFNSYSKPYNKQLNNLDRSVVTGKSQTSAYRIDLAIARSIRQGLGLRFSRNDLTLGY